MKQLPPQKRPNAELRSREFLTEAEVASLITAARKVGRHGSRDATMILLAFRHGLRVSELLALRWDQVDLKEGKLFVSGARTAQPAPICCTDRNSGSCEGYYGTIPIALTCS